MPTKVISLRVDEGLLSIIEQRAKLENRTLSNMIIAMISRYGCTGCPMFSKVNGVRMCGEKEISGFISKPDDNPIPNWCPLSEK